MGRNWAKSLRELLYPPACLLCGETAAVEEEICPGCREELPYNRHPCPICAEPLPPSASPTLPCGVCLRDPPPFDCCLAPLRYDYPVPYLAAGLKFRGRLDHARILSRLLLEHLIRARDGENLPERILPVPLHPSRLKERGFNQALEIARPIARRLGIPLDLDTCIRRRATAPQSSLEREARRKNLRGAFLVTAPPTFRRVALVDDIVTTGNTVAALAKTLKQAGVERVEVWAVAKTAAE